MHDMSAKVCLITGANNGFGYETALGLAQRGAQVVMVCRSAQRGADARERIADATGNRPDLLLADLRIQAEVKRVAAEFRTAYARLDVLINNAGYAYTPREETDEGYEQTFALNYLAYVTLTLELIDMLLATAPARIINTASRAHRWDGIDFDNLQGQRDFPPGMFGMPMMYGWSNLYRIMFTYELAQRLAGTGVVANTLCPGFVPVKRSSAPAFLNALMPLFNLLPNATSPREAAKTFLYLATDPAAAQTGLYYEDGVPARSSDDTYNAAKRQRLWQETLALLGYETDPLTQIAQE